jgi:hypothetical protein
MEPIMPDPKIPKLTAELKRLSSSGIHADTLPGRRSDYLLSGEFVGGGFGRWLK